MAELLLISYFAVLGCLATLGIYRLILTAVAVRRRAQVPPPTPEAWPAVLIQLPIYDEALVAERLLRAAARLRYPGTVTIQVLDDSTDETSRILDRTAQELREQGHDVRVDRRSARTGYKAGALAAGLVVQPEQPLVAIFDADFLPPSDFLERTVPALLSDPRIGLVQARWGHVNRDRSLLTRAQAIFLDGHFSIEHQARARAGHFFNFNGTAGVWRRAAIEGAGGWTADTITEDLDLSYRAQLAGWRFAYLDDVVAPAELPESWAAFRSQQARWVRGSVETAKKHLGRLLVADLPFALRVDAAIHLTNNFAYLLMALLACFLPSAVVLRDQLGWRIPGGQPLLSLLDLTMLTAGTFAMIVFYAAAVFRTEGRLTLGRFAELLYALCIGAGMSISNAREVLSGLFTRRSEFVRTPKRGEATLALALATYRSRSRAGTLLIEALFLCYFTAAAAYAVRWGLWGALPFLLLYLVGFASVVAGHLREAYSSSSSRMISVTPPSTSSSSSSTGIPAAPPS